MFVRTRIKDAADRRMGHPAGLVFAWFCLVFLCVLPTTILHPKRGGQQYRGTCSRWRCARNTDDGNIDKQWRREDSKFVSCGRGIEAM